MIAVTPKSFLDNEVLMKELAEAFPDEVITRGFEPYADAAIIGSDPVDGMFLDDHGNLRCIAKYGVGLDNIDLEECKMNWVRVLWTPGINSQYVAEHALGLMLSMLRKIDQNSRLLKAGTWRRDGGRSLEGLSVGIVGYGNVGQALRGLLMPFRPGRVLSHDLRKTDAYEETASKEEIYKTCDVITLHVPLTNETKHMITMYEIMQMKRSAILINTSRGAVIKQSALKEALRRGIIAGAALDVFEDEPCEDTELLQMDNVLCTPHTAGNSEQAVLAMGRAAIANLKRMVEP